MHKRDYKNFGEGCIVHVYNRGNNREKIFFEEADCKAFLFRLGLALGFDLEELNRQSLTSVPHSRIRITGGNKKNFKLLGFCLMKNHFHLLIEQCSNVPISKLISSICTSYAMYINKKYSRVGHIFQDQFKSVLIESDEQLLWSLAYIHSNPLKSRLVDHPQQYVWSSYQDYTAKRDLPIVSTSLLKEKIGLENFEKETLAAVSRGILDIVGLETD